jgi:hypothetical protein
VQAVILVAVHVAMAMSPSCLDQAWLERMYEHCIGGHEVKHRPTHGSSSDQSSSGGCHVLRLLTWLTEARESGRRREDVHAITRWRDAALGRRLHHHSRGGKQQHQKHTVCHCTRRITRNHPSRRPRLSCARCCRVGLSWAVVVLLCGDGCSKPCTLSQTSPW